MNTDLGCKCCVYFQAVCIFCQNAYAHLTWGFLGGINTVPLQEVSGGVTLGWEKNEPTIHEIYTAMCDVSYHMVQMYMSQTSFCCFRMFLASRSHIENVLLPPFDCRYPLLSNKLRTWFYFHVLFAVDCFSPKSFPFTVYSLPSSIVWSSGFMFFPGFSQKWNILCSPFHFFCPRYDATPEPLEPVLWHGLRCGDETMWEQHQQLCTSWASQKMDKPSEGRISWTTVN